MNDVINRKDAIGAILSVGHIAELSDGDAVIRVSAVNYVLRNLPSAQPEINTDVDTISRQAAIDALDEQIDLCNKALGSFDISTKDEYAIKVERASLKVYREQLENLPSVQPERKTGRWIQKSRTVMGGDYTERWYECSECNKRPLRSRWTDDDNLSDWCPHCGSPMEKEGEA